MYYCMNKSELGAFIDFKAAGKAVDDKLLRLRIEDSEAWGDQLGALTYLLSHLLDRYLKESSYDCIEIITNLYGLEDSMNFCLHESDVTFVKFMLGNLRDREIDLADELVALQSHLSRYEYGTTIRFGY